MKTYTKIQLQNKLDASTDQLKKTIGISSRRTLLHSIKYYTIKIAQFDENINLKTIEA